jgi:hypothetical protein
LGLPFDLSDLLAQGVQAGELDGAGFVGVRRTMSSPSARAGQKPTTPLAVNHFSSTILQHRLGVLRTGRWRPGRRSSSSRISGIAADQLPAGEERRPVDVPAEILQVVAFEGPDADEGRLGRA